MSAADSLSPAIAEDICWQFKYDLHTLYTLARTCRTFYSVALKFIWRRLICPNALFLTLPESSVVRRERPHSEGSPQFLKWILEPARPSFSPDELERFYLHASFVEWMELPHYPSGNLFDFYVSPGIWRHFERADASPIFPHLRHMSCNESWRVPSEDSTPLHLFLAPELEDLSIHFWNVQDESGTGGPATSLNQLLASLPLEAPRIHSLHLTIGPFEDAQDNLAQTLRKLSYLTHFYLSGISLSPADIAALSSLPVLEYAEFSARASDFPPDSVTDGGPLDFISFPAIKRLYLSADTIECVLGLLRWSVMDAPVLTELAILISSPFPAPRFTALTTTIADMRCRRTLDSLMVITKDPRGSGNGSSPIAIAVPPSAISPLYILPALTCLRIGGYAYVSFDDASLADLAHAWPRLTTLSASEDCAVPPGVTLAGLLDLTQRCPRLREVGLALADIDRATCEDILARPVPDMHHALPLRCLCVGVASVRAEDTAAVAAVLSMHFPLLGMMEHALGPSDEDPRERRWDLVVDALYAFQKVRFQERKYARKSLYHLAR